MRGNVRSTVDCKYSTSYPVPCHRHGKAINRGSAIKAILDGFLGCIVVQTIHYQMKRPPLVCSYPLSLIPVVATAISDLYKVVIRDAGEKPLITSFLKNGSGCIVGHQNLIIEKGRPFFRSDWA